VELDYLWLNADIGIQVRQQIADNVEAILHAWQVRGIILGYIYSGFATGRCSQRTYFFVGAADCSQPPSAIQSNTVFLFIISWDRRIVSCSHHLVRVPHGIPLLAHVDGVGQCAERMHVLEKVLVVLIVSE
jgi:hypothetical protein